MRISWDDVEHQLGELKDKSKKVREKMLAAKGRRIIIASLIFILSLTSGSIANTVVTGDVTGTWTSAGNPYLVTGDVNVPVGETLIIEAGVEIYLTGIYDFTVNGLLQANGTADARISFHGGGAPGSWKKIYFAETAANECLLNFCTIRDGGADNLGSVYLLNNGTKVTISNCEIYKSSSQGIYVLSDVSVYGNDNITRRCEPLISGNYIHKNNTDGIYIYAYYNNRGSGNSSTYRGDDNTSIAAPQIKNNIIHANSGNGITCNTYANGNGGASNYGDYNPTIQANPQIQQNSIVGNGANGIHCSRSIVDHFLGNKVIEANPMITSNILCENAEAGLNAGNCVAVLNVKYNDFWDNEPDLNGISDGIGEITQTNLNGDPCDINRNIFFNPEFKDVENADFHLKASSKCIDAGDLSLPFDSDNSFPDIGALVYTEPVPEVAAPQMDPLPGSYSKAQNITLTCATPGAVIHFTINGDEPTESSSVYSSPIPVATTTTIKARGYLSGSTPSDIVTGEYIIGAPDIAINPAEWDFGTVDFGNSSEKMFVISNSGSGDLDVSMTTISGMDAADFSIINGGGPFTLSPAGSENLTIRFMPLSEGDKKAVLTIVSNDPDENSLLVTLEGQVPTHAPPILEVSPATLDFGASLTSLDLEITNNGAGTLVWLVTEKTPKSWITSINPSDGSDSKSVTVTVDRNKLSGTSDTGILEVTSNGGNQEITVLIAEPPAPVPVVLTMPATDVAATTATLNGLIIPQGTITDYYFQFDTSTNYNLKTPVIQIEAGTDPLSVNSALTDLSPNTTYYFRIVAVNSSGTSVGKDKTFTTLSLPQIATPYFDPAPGSYLIPQYVQIKCSTPGVTIYYTTDGTEPDESSARYTSSVYIPTTTKLKARAYLNNWLPSDAASGIYTIDDSFMYQAGRIPAAMDVPVIDGYLDEPYWEAVDADTLAFGGVPELWETTWTDWNNNCVTWKAVWSEVTNKLYVAITIRDDIKSSFDQSDPSSNFEPWNDDCLELFVDPNNDGGDYQNAWQLAQQWLITGENQVVLCDYPNSSGYYLYTGDKMISAAHYTSGGNWICEAEFQLYDLFPLTRKTLKQGDVVGWNIWYDDSDNATRQASRYQRDYQVGWLYNGKANNNADYFGDIFLAEDISIKPDLTISALSGPETISQGVGFDVSVTVDKTGPALSGYSVPVSVYLSTDSQIDETDYPLGSSLTYQYLTANLNITGTVTEKMECSVTGSLSPGKYYLGAIVDPSQQNQYPERNEFNNSFTAKQITLTNSPFEPDDTWQQAGWITVNAAQQNRTLEPAGDVDWVKFTAQAGVQYSIETKTINSNHCDTYLFLYNTDAATLLRSDDDAGEYYLSKIVWNCTGSGTYYIKVFGYSKNTTGSYGLVVETIGSDVEPPRNLTAESGYDCQVPLTWDAPAAALMIGDEPAGKKTSERRPELAAISQLKSFVESSSAASLTGYNIYMSTSSTQGFSKIGSTLSTKRAYKAAGLVNDTRYYFYVTAVYSNPTGESNASNVADATPAAPLPVLSISPVTLDFGTSIIQKNFTIQNTGAGTLTWSAYEYLEKDWLISFAPSFGELSAGQSQPVTVQVDRSMLSGNQDTAAIRVISSGGYRDVTVLIESDAIGVGDGAPNPQLFIDCYQRVDGAVTLGQPTEQVSRQGNGYIQYFQSDDGVIMKPDSKNAAYAVFGPIGAKYKKLGRFSSDVGYPVGDAITTRAVVEKHTTDGKYQAFEEGHICWHSEGLFANQTFETHGDIDQYYTLLGGPSSALGFAVHDEYVNRDGFPESYFEDGFITTSDRQTYSSFRSADLDGNFEVNVLDFSFLSSYWFTDGKESPSYRSPDIVQDGLVNGVDYSMMSSQWGEIIPSEQSCDLGLSKSSIPEINTLPSLPTDYYLDQNYPNPFNPVTTIRFGLPQAATVHLKIVNTLGQTIRTLAESEKAAGNYSLTWNGKDDTGHEVAGGIYFYVLQTESFYQCRKLVLIR